MTVPLAHPLVDDEYAAVKALCKTCGEPAETPLAYCRAHRLTARPYQTIDINALDHLDPIHANNARLAEHGENIDAQGDPDWSTNPGLYAISAATKGAI